MNWLKAEFLFLLFHLDLTELTHVTHNRTRESNMYNKAHFSQDQEINIFIRVQLFVVKSRYALFERMLFPLGIHNTETHCLMYSMFYRYQTSPLGSNMKSNILLTFVARFFINSKHVQNQKDFIFIIKFSLTAARLLCEI